ncbi:hypothetical protein I41_09400 [Lacipirellula limnantheis]|uniref:Uncharacterized protein n=1 Tax=Lacipirellula limnantheis TaxID=2528024 RepID=A0A517TTS8_9BACT|nr:hypothetical protein I41_09400 [Lacipirellula limnantheis]
MGKGLSNLHLVLHKRVSFTLKHAIAGLLRPTCQAPKPKRLIGRV